MLPLPKPKPPLDPKAAGVGAKMKSDTTDASRFDGSKRLSRIASKKSTFQFVPGAGAEEPEKLKPAPGWCVGAGKMGMKNTKTDDERTTSCS